MPPIPRGYQSAVLGCLLILRYRRPGQAEELGIELAASMLAKAVGDSRRGAQLDTLVERLVAEPDQAARQELAEEVLTLASLWTAEVVDVAVDLCTLVACPQHFRVVHESAGGPPDAA